MTDESWPSTQVEQARRRAESMKRQLGQFCGLLAKPGLVELMLNHKSAMFDLVFLSADRVAIQHPVGLILLLDVYAASCWRSPRIGVSDHLGQCPICSSRHVSSDWDEHLSRPIYRAKQPTNAAAVFSC